MENSWRIVVYVVIFSRVNIDHNKFSSNLVVESRIKSRTIPDVDPETISVVCHVGIA